MSAIVEFVSERTSQTQTFFEDIIIAVIGAFLSGLEALGLGGFLLFMAFLLGMGIVIILLCGAWIKSIAKVVWNQIKKQYENIKNK